MQNEAFKIGIAGAKGSFSEEAAVEYLRRYNKNDAVLNYLVSVENVLSHVTKGDADIGIFPIENSNGGIVYEAVYAMARYVFAIEEFFEIDVRHNLLVKPGKSASAINTITSHDQALKQCRMYLKRKWPEVELREYSDTAQAARDLGDGLLSDETAVIAPRSCAGMYHLDILEENIQDLKFNFTTFVVAGSKK